MHSLRDTKQRKRPEKRAAANHRRGPQTAQQTIPYREMLRDGKNNVYIGQGDFGAHLWYTLRDAPDGFCERDYIISRSVEFIICTADWTPIGRDGNDRERFAEPYPTWAEACEKAWKRIRKEYPHVTLEGFDEWIESFAPQIMEAYEKRNWRNIYKKTVDRKILCRFNYLG